MCTDAKSCVRRFSVQDVTFVVLSFLCVKALAIYGVPRPAVVLLALLAGTFCSFFGFFSEAALCEAETVASSATFGSHETLEGVDCPYDSSFWYDASYACVLTGAIPDSVLEMKEQEACELGSSSGDAQLELINGSDELRERIMAFGS